MNITTAHLPLFCKTLEDALTDQKTWIGFDNRIEQLSAYDLHFFTSAQLAADFQLFNHSQGREVTLLPVEALLLYVQETARNLLKEGKQFSQLEIDDMTILGFYADSKTDERITELQELMDQYDWKKVLYDPLEANVQAENFDEILAFNRLEYMVEQLSVLAQSGERGMAAVVELTGRHWTGMPMEGQIAEVLGGKYAQSTRELFFHHKNEVMNTENLDYLQNQLKFLGFGEGLNTQLERNLKEGLPDFQLQASHQFGKDQMEATLYFKRSEREGQEMYFFNKYDATLTQGDRNLSQTFYINNKGQSITFKESCNLLNGRAVFKELAPKEGEKYKAWVKLDFSNREENGNAKVKHFHENFGYDVREALGRVPLKELSDPDKLQTLVASLEKGNLAQVTLVKDGAEKPVLITTDPQYKSLKMYDMEGKKLYVPAEKQDQRYGQAPVDEKRVENGLQASVGDELGTKKVELLPVNEIREGMGQKI